MSDSGGAEPQRPRLNLKPRDPNVAKQLELQRQASGKVRMDGLLQCRSLFVLVLSL